ncbi:MAG: DUF1937 family protein [Gammaproteobacteria bacterium]|nr:DUF1937 family protein [Gammaproteobacteria bacterium]
MKLYYVAGPFSAKTREGVEENIRAADFVGRQLARICLYPVVPHNNTAHPQYERLQPYPFWIAGTLELLKCCDALVVVPGWEESSGARGEVAWALGETGPTVVRWFYRLKRRLTGTGRRPVYLHPYNALMRDPAFRRRVPTCLTTAREAGK